MMNVITVDEYAHADVFLFDKQVGHDITQVTTNKSNYATQYNYILFKY